MSVTNFSSPFGRSAMPSTTVTVFSLCPSDRVLTLKVAFSRSIQIAALYFFRLRYLLDHYLYHNPMPRGHAFRKVILTSCQLVRVQHGTVPPIEGILKRLARVNDTHIILSSSQSCVEHVQPLSSTTAALWRRKRDSHYHLHHRKQQR
jgi:hypothetical protein